MTAYENRIKLLELIVYLEKKLGKQFPVIGFGENFGDYIRDKFGYEGNIDTNKIGAITNIKDIALAILSKKDSLQESYSKFKTETKTRGKSDQFHQAVREVRRKVQEINRLFEYVSRLKLELSEGEGGLKYKVHTEKALAKIKEMVSELNQNIKKFK
jgi:hypothetical protein